MQNRRLHVLELATGDDRVLVEEDGEDIAWGLAEFIAAEEMDRTRGYWWSPDGRSLLAERSDRGPVPRWTIADPANPQHPANVVAYPAAGTTNALVSLAVLGLDGSRVDVAPGEWEYLASVHWSAGGAPLLAVQPRDQKRMDVLALDVTDGSTVGRAHRDRPALDRHRRRRPGVDARRAAGRRGHGRRRPPAVRRRRGRHRRPGCSCGPCSTSATRSSSARPRTTRRRSTCSATEGASVRRLSTVDGVHVGAGSAAVTVLSSWSLEHSGPRVSVLRDGAPVASIASSTVDPDIVPNLTWLTLGERGLRAALLLPRGYEPSEGKLPVLLDPYGGPHAQRVLQSRNAFLTSQWLADQGFAVLVADGRGTPGRGAVWEREIAGPPRRRHPAGPGRRAAGGGRRVPGTGPGARRDPRLVLRRLPVGAGGAAPPGRVPRGGRGRAGHRLVAVRHALHRAVPRASRRTSRRATRTTR